MAMTCRFLVPQPLRMLYPRQVFAAGRLQPDAVVMNVLQLISGNLHLPASFSSECTGVNFGKASHK